MKITIKNFEQIFGQLLELEEDCVRKSEAATSIKQLILQVQKETQCLRATIEEGNSCITDLVSFQIKYLDIEHQNSNYFLTIYF